MRRGVWLARYRGSFLDWRNAMQVVSTVSRISRILFVLLLAAGSVALVGGSKSAFTPLDKAYWAPRELVDFVNPGLNITINSATIASSGAITITYTLTDPNGLPLDASGATTPGAISLAYVAAYIPTASSNTRPSPPGPRRAQCWEPLPGRISSCKRRKGAIRRRRWARVNTNTPSRPWRPRDSIPRSLIRWLSSAAAI